MTTPQTSMLSALAIALVLASAGARADSDGEVAAPAARLRCPGDNAAYFEEIREAGAIGFGETWDFDVCDEGLEIYAEGANRRWRAMRPRLAHPRPSVSPGLDAGDILFYSTALPYGAFGTLGLVFVIAWIVSLLQRKKEAPSVVVTCTGCQRGVPVRPEEGGVFCPACGTIALVERAADRGAS